VQFLPQLRIERHELHSECIGGTAVRLRSPSLRRSHLLGHLADRIDDKAETDLGQRDVNGVERPPFGSVG
jgi:hypothetical protein